MCIRDSRDPVVTPAVGSQRSFDELGEPLREVTFVVVDLETTGGAPVDADITEIGAVKVRGGEVLGDFGTLVDPGRDIPPQIVRLTGITTAMVHDAPTIDAVLPMFLEFSEFSRGAVLVAHNAGFDTGFLRAAAARCGIAWPAPLAPFQVVLVPLNMPKSERVRELAERLYAELTAAGIEVLFDDRDASPGAKFAHAELLGQPRRLQRRLHDRLVHHGARVPRCRGARVLVHQAGQQLLVERAPVDADAHRLAVLLRQLDDGRELAVLLVLEADIAGVDAILVERGGTAGIVAQQLVADVVEIADDRHVDAAGAQLLVNARHGLSLINISEPTRPY